MSSIRLYVLDALGAGGPMYGHQLKLLAESEHAQEWTDISVGALYGALKRLSSEGLIEGIRFEREGSYPERQVYGITPAGRVALAATKSEALREIVVRSDPFDLAISRLDRDKLDVLEGLLIARIVDVKRMASEAEARVYSIGAYLTLAEKLVVMHRAARLRTEVQWHEDLLKQLPDIISEELGLDVDANLIS